MQQKSVFISYRRKEGLREARALFERLSREFGSDKVFIDLAGIQPGEDFITLLESLLANCAVLLVLIGPGWAGGTRSDGRRRLDDAGDFVRIEIVAALKRGVRIIPVCFDGAEMPGEAELPEELRPLVRRQSVVLDFHRFENDIRPLIDAVRATLAAPRPSVPAPPSPDTPQPASLSRGSKPHWAFSSMTLLAALGLAALSLTPHWLQGPAVRESVVQALVDSQRLTAASGQAVLGSEAAFTELAAAGAGLRTSFDEIEKADASEKGRETTKSLQPIVERSLKNTAVIAGQQKTLIGVGTALRAVNRIEPDLLELAEAVHALQLQIGGGAAELSASSQLVMLTQRIPRSVNEFFSTEGVRPEAIFLLGSDLKSFQEIAQALLNGSPELRLPGTKNAQVRERIQSLMRSYAGLREQCSTVLGNLQGLVSARDAHARIVRDTAPLRSGFEQMRKQVDDAPALRGWAMTFAAALLTGAAGWAGLFGALARRRVKAK